MCKPVSYLQSPLRAATWKKVYLFCRSMLRSLLDSAMSSEDLLLEPSKGSVHSRGRQPTRKGGMAGGAWAPRHLIGWCPAMHLLFATIPSHSEWVQKLQRCFTRAHFPSGIPSSLSRALSSVSVQTNIHLRPDAAALTHHRGTAMQRQSDRGMVALRQGQVADYV